MACRLCGKLALPILQKADINTLCRFIRSYLEQFRSYTLRDDDLVAQMIICGEVARMNGSQSGNECD